MYEKIGRTFCIGDLHGNYRALMQCLERCNFDYENDTLITLGDITDGWDGVYECVDQLLLIKNRIDIRGNHDNWLVEWIDTTVHSEKWSNGGLGTLQSYCRNLGKNVVPTKGGWFTNLLPTDLPEKHIRFFKSQHYYYVDNKNRCFVHGGFNRHLTMKEQMYPDIFWWDRDLWQSALGYKSMEDKRYSFKMKENFSEVYIGHTATTAWRDKQGVHITIPMWAANICNVDTGAGFTGKLTIMDVDTKEYWQSDLCEQLYPGLRSYH